MRRNEFQAMARTRLREARRLLTSGEPSGAYYLAGYAVECGLKAVIARQFRNQDIPDKALVNRIYTHKLEELVTIAGLAGSLQAQQTASAAFRLNWRVVSGWSEASRYVPTSIAVAQDMVRGVGQRNTGVLAWIRTNW
jgi:hypothetical protein